MKQETNLLLFITLSISFAITSIANATKSPEFEDKVLLLRGQVEMESYERTRRLCDLFTKPELIYSSIHDPISEYLLNPKFRASINEWYGLMGWGFRGSIIGDEKEKIVQLTTLYTDLLVKSKGFEEATNDCFQKVSYSKINAEQFRDLVRYGVYAFDISGNGLGWAGWSLTFLAAGKGVTATAKILGSKPFLVPTFKLFRLFSSWIGGDLVEPVVKRFPLLRNSLIKKSVLSLSLGAGAFAYYIDHRKTQIQSISISDFHFDLGQSPPEVFSSGDRANWEFRLATYSEILLQLREALATNPPNLQMLNQVSLKIDGILPDIQTVHNKLKILRSRDDWPKDILQIKAILEEIDKQLLMRQNDNLREYQKLLSSNYLSSLQSARKWRLNVIFELQKLNQGEPLSASDFERLLQLNEIERLLQKKAIDGLSSVEQEHLESLGRKYPPKY